MNEYVYTYKFVDQVHDTGLSIPSTIGFSVATTYKTITESNSISMTVGKTISFNSSIDSKLGTFARIKTNKYCVKVTNKYTGNEIRTYYENMASVSDRSYRPIYRNTSNNIIFKYSCSHYQAKILKSSTF